MDVKTPHMDRRFFIGALAVTAGTAAGGFPLAAGATTLGTPAAAAPGVGAVFMDIPFVDTTGLHRAYRPPAMNLALAQHYDPHFYV